MRSQVCWAAVFVLWASTAIANENNKVNSGSWVEMELSDSSEVSLSDRVKLLKVNAKRIRRETNSLMLKVKLHNGSYLYRKVQMTPSKKASPKKGASLKAAQSVTRVARGYTDKKKKKGYRYKKPGYVYTTPSTTTRLPPLAETQEENDSQSLQPPEEEPTGLRPDRDFVTEAPAPLDPWDIRDSVPGEPGKDYKVHGSIPETNFTCEGRTPGFYADPETGCQVFHRCTDDPWYTGQVRVTMDSFLCPNGSLFNQQILTCDWWGNIDCETATEFYQLNEQIGQLEETNAGTIQYVQFGGVRVPPPPGHKRKAPGIVPKARRKPLPEQYRSKHGHDHEGNPIASNNNNNKAGNHGLRATAAEDPDNLANKFLEDDGRGFSEFSAGKDDTHEDDKEGSSQNIEEVSARPPKSLKKGRKSSKKSKTTTTTTTTTTPPPEEEAEEDEEEDAAEDEDENNDDTEEDDQEEDDQEEETAATNDQNNPSGFIVNRPGQGPQGIPKEVLEPPNFSGEPVDSDRERSEENQDSGTYIPPSPAGPTYIPPTTQAPTYIPPTQSGYTYPTPPQNGNYLPPNKSYLPPQNTSYGVQPTNTYLPPQNNPYGQQQNNNQYLPSQQGYQTPQQNHQYLPPAQNTYLPPNNNAYLPPQQNNNNAYLPPQQNNNNAYLPPQQNNNNAYLPPQQNNNNAYLPPQQNNNNAYLLPQQNNNNAYLPPQQNNNNAYLPPQQNNNNAYLPPQQNNNNAYLPPQQTTPGYLPSTTPSSLYLPPNTQQQGYQTPQNQNNASYLPPQNQGVYLPPQQTTTPGYLPNTTPNALYLPPQQGYQDPNHNRQYLPPSNSPQNSYSSPNNYNDFNIVKNQYPPPPTTASHVRYSTIPVQTPPSVNGFTYGKPSNYGARSQVSIEFVHVPLVSSSHSRTNHKR